MANSMLRIILSKVKVVRWINAIVNNRGLLAARFGAACFLLGTKFEWVFGASDHFDFKLWK
jgi:hypothetical protein